jgi:hypothetical protein
LGNKRRPGSQSSQEKILFSIDHRVNRPCFIISSLLELADEVIE